MTLEKIINRLKDNHDINISGNYERNNQIKNIYKINKETFFPLIEQTLFFQIKKGLETDKLSIEKIPNLNESFIIKTSDSNLLEQFYEEAVRTLNEEKNLDLEYSKLFNIIKDGKGLDQLVYEAHQFLNNPINICDLSFTILASYPRVQDKENLITTEKKQYLKDKKFQNMLDENIIDHLYHSRESIITNIEDYSYHFLFKSVQINNKTVGYICIRETVRPINNKDLKYLDILSDMLAIELQKESFYQNIPINNYESYFIDLIKGEHVRSDVLKKKLLKNIKTQSAYFSIALINSKNILSRSKQKIIQDEISTLIPGSLTTYYEGNIIILIASNTSNSLEKVNIERLEAFLRSYKLKLFVSYSFIDLKNSQIYYNQIKDLAYQNEITENKKSQLIHRYDEFYLDHLFQKYPDKSQLIATIHPDIRKLFDYDNEYNTEFLTTLRTYLENNRNAKEAAKILHIHKSTFFYRIGKIEELFGITIKDPNKLFAYEYSLRLLNFLS